MLKNGQMETDESVPLLVEQPRIAVVYISVKGWANY